MSWIKSKGVKPYDMDSRAASIFFAMKLIFAIQIYFTFGDRFDCL